MAEAPKPRKASEDSVKLFVGQVPKNMTEAQLLAMFKEFALVDEVNIIKDKATRASRGFQQPYALAKSRLLSVSSNSSRIFDFPMEFLPDRECVIRAPSSIWFQI